MYKSMCLLKKVHYIYGILEIILLIIYVFMFIGSPYFAWGRSFERLQFRLQKGIRSIWLHLSRC